jgi:hypothetical protein
MANEDVVIHFSDPDKDTFVIKPFSVEMDPSASLANTSLRLWGKGLGSYGERTMENLVHILENFAGATFPNNPIEGQLYWQVLSYWQYTGGSPKWNQWNEITSDWDTIVVTEQASRPNVSAGYWLNTGTNELYQGFTIDSTEVWVLREYTVQATIPVTTDIPERTLFVYASGSWTVVNKPQVNDREPDNGEQGQFWYDTGSSPNELKIHDGTNFVSIAATIAGDFLLRDGTNAMLGNLNFGLSRGINVADPVSDADATNRQWISNDSSDFIVVDTGTSPPTTLQLFYDDNLINGIRGDKTTLQTFSGNISLGGKYIQNLATPPLNDQDASSKKYVDDEITNALATSVTTTDLTITDNGSGTFDFTISQSGGQPQRIDTLDLTGLEVTVFADD